MQDARVRGPGRLGAPGPGGRALAPLVHLYVLIYYHHMTKVVLSLVVYFSFLSSLASDLGRALASHVKRVLECGVRTPVFYGNLREKTDCHKTCRKLVFFLRKSPKISGNLREFSGECNLGILHTHTYVYIYIYIYIYV